MSGHGNQLIGMDFYPPVFVFVKCFDELIDDNQPQLYIFLIFVENPEKQFR